MTRSVSGRVQRVSLVFVLRHRGRGSGGNKGDEGGVRIHSVVRVS